MWGFGPLISARPDLLTSKERMRLKTGAIVNKQTKKTSGHWGASWLGNTLMGGCPILCQEGEGLTPQGEDTGLHLGPSGLAPCVSSFAWP